MSNISNRLQRRSLPERLLDSSNGLALFCLAIGIVYCLVPLISYLALPVGEAFAQLAAISLCAVSAMLLGGKIRLLDYRFRQQAPRLFISSRTFVTITWGLFALFIIVTFSTAPSIPFVSALQGASATELSQERGDFLKGREGAGIALLYISTFLTNTLVPYSIVLLYAGGSKWRHIAALAFFLFCLSFMQKALFLNLVLPMVAYLAMSRQLSNKMFVGFSIGSIVLLIAVTFLSLGGNDGVETGFEPSNYLSAQYSPSGALDYFFWRTIAVPVFTATDTLFVYADTFLSSPLLGATSGVVSLIFGIERINIERFVFEYQFGSWNEIANSNSVFVVDAYVNFGWLGVIIFGLFVGQLFRWFRLSHDIAFRSLWLSFSFLLFTGSLIGTLLSNGFLLFFLLGLMVKVPVRARDVIGSGVGSV